MTEEEKDEEEKDFEWLTEEEEGVNDLSNRELDREYLNMIKNRTDEIRRERESDKEHYSPEWWRKLRVGGRKEEPGADENGEVELEQTKPAPLVLHFDVDELVRKSEEEEFMDVIDDLEELLGAGNDAYALKPNENDTDKMYYPFAKDCYEWAGRCLDDASLKNKLILSLKRLKFEPDKLEDMERVEPVEEPLTELERNLIDYMQERSLPLYYDDIEERFDLSRREARDLTKTLDKKGWIQVKEKEGEKKEFYLR